MSKHYVPSEPNRAFPSTEPNLIDFDWLKERAADLRAHPDFDRIGQTYTTMIMRVFEHDHYMIKIASTETRYLACLAILGKYLQRSLETGKEGLSSADVLEAALRGSGLGSRNRVSGLVGLMMIAKIVTVEQSTSDARKRILKLTDNGKVVAQYFNAAALHAIDSLHGTTWSHAASTDTGFLSRFYLNAVQTYADVGRLIPKFGPYQFLWTRTGGCEIVHRLWIAADRDGEVRARNVVFPFGVVAKSLGVSRGHVRQIMADGAQLGLFDLIEDGGQLLSIRPPFLELYRNLISMEFAILAHSAETAQDSK